MVYTVVHGGGRLVPVSLDMAGITMHVYDGGNRCRWILWSDDARDVDWVHDCLRDVNGKRRDTMYFFEVLPTDGGLRTIQKINDDDDANAFAELGQRVAFINLYVTSYDVGG